MDAPRERNRALAAMTTSYLWHAYSQNPNTETFPWSGCGYNGAVPRWAILEELQNRRDGRALLFPGTVEVDSWEESCVKNARYDHKRYLDSLMLSELITVVISSSPTPNHDVIYKCYDAMRKHLPDCQTYILLDGVRSEQSDLQTDYKAYKTTLKQQNWQNTKIIESPEFRHEAGQMRSFMQSSLCRTPLICYLQHDAILVDEFIDWRGIASSLQDNIVSCIRFALDIGFPQGKEHMFRGQILTKFGVPLLLITELFTTACIARVDFFDYITRQFNTAKCHLDGDEIQPVTARDNGLIRKIGHYCPIETDRYGFLRVTHADARRAGIDNPPPKLMTEF